MKLFLTAFIALTVLSCKNVESFKPHYELITVTYIPDSLKEKQREWVKETVRAASQNMTAGDYENINETIIQAERSSENLYGIEVITLRKHYGEEYYERQDILPQNLTAKEQKILNNLLKN